MFNPKSTIYQTEWLDLVFANRNKSYGAYELRQNSDKRLVQALLITSFLVMALFSYPIIRQWMLPAETFRPAEPTREVTFDLLPKPEPIITPTAPPTPPSLPKSRPEKLRTERFLKPLVVHEPVTDEPPTIKQLENAVIGSVKTDGQSSALNTNPIETSGGNGDGLDASQAGASNGNAPVEWGLLEKSPEFPGGMEAFIRYLRKNLQFPEQAREAGVSGKVFVSFVVEKDGRLTDITVIKGIGFGCDEEAARVLKKSPAWTPGIQNAKAVRVLYRLPLFFQLEK